MSNQEVTLSPLFRSEEEQHVANPNRKTRRRMNSRRRGGRSVQFTTPVTMESDLGTLPSNYSELDEAPVGAVSARYTVAEDSYEALPVEKEIAAADEPSEENETTDGMVPTNDAGAALPQEDLPTDKEKAAADTLSELVASWFVRSDNRYYSVDRPSRSLSVEDVKRISLLRFKQRYPEIELLPTLVREVFRRSLEGTHTNAKQSVAVWSGDMECQPESTERVVREDGMATINTWSTPAYRLLGETSSDLSPLTALLGWMMPRAQDRELFLAWLAWNLQNEADKPHWSIFLYSKEKGTGKSTLAQLAVKLFGRENSYTQNSVSKLTARFNAPLLQSKFVVCEELQLKPESTQGNTLKTYITEKETTTEGKGKELSKTRQCCAFLFTSNHFPTLMGGGERRYLVIDVGHDGHASGSKSREFGDTIELVNRVMEDPAALARLYNALMAYQIPNSFNAKTLNTTELDSPIMQEIAYGSQEVLLGRLEEYLDKHEYVALSQDRLVCIFTDVLKANSNRAGHLIRDLGWRTDKAKWGGADYTRLVYVRKDYHLVHGHIVGPDGFKEPMVEIGVALKPFDPDDIELIF